MKRLRPLAVTTTSLLFLGVVLRAGDAVPAGLPTQYFGYAMCQNSSTMMVIDTSTNTVVSKVKHPDFIKGAWGRFHPTKKRYYAGGTGKFTIWDTTDLARPVYLKTVTPVAASTGEIRGFFINNASTTAIDGQVWLTNTADQNLFIYNAADLEGPNPTPVKTFAAADGLMRPHYMQRRPGTNEVWLTNRSPSATGYLLRFDSSNNTIITTPTTKLETTSVAGDEPTEFAFSKDGALAYVGHHGNPITGSPSVTYAVGIVDAATFTVKKIVKTISQQQTPSYMDVDNDAGRAYFVAKWGPTLVVLDQKTERVLRYVELGGFGPAYGVATTPDYKYLYISLGSPAQSAVVVVDAKTLTVVANIVDSDCDNVRSVRFTHY
jgi:DNA-binding beta-propeller fold protein YncE